MRDWPEPDQDTLLDILETWDLGDEEEAREESAEYEEKTKAEASITKAKADLILVETEIALAKTKATEAEAIVNLTIAKATLIESGSVDEDLGAEVRSKAQTTVDIAEAALAKAQIAKEKTEDDLAKAKTDLAAAIALTQSLNQTNRKRLHPPPRRKVHQK